MLSSNFSLYLLTNWRWKIWQDILIYHINYGFIQGFPALRKAITSQVKKYNIFSGVFDLLISCWHITCLLCYHSQSKVVCQNFFRLWLLKHWKICIAGRQWHSNFPIRGRNKMWKEKPKVMYSVALVMKFLVAESENRIQEDLPQVDFMHCIFLFPFVVKVNFFRQ